MTKFVLDSSMFSCRFLKFSMRVLSMPCLWLYINKRNALIRLRQFLVSCWLLKSSMTVCNSAVYSYIVIGILVLISPLTTRCLTAIYRGPLRHYIALLSRSYIWLLLTLLVLDIAVLGAVLSRSSTTVGSSMSFVSGSRKKRKVIIKQRLPKAAPGPQGTYRA